MILCVIPAYCPSEGLIKLVKDLLDNKIHCLVVDDGGGEKYAPIFSQLPEDTILLTHKVNKGKGAALKTAMTHIKENMPHVSGIVTADSDGQHTVEQISKAMEALSEHPEALVLGGRKFDGKVPLRSRFGNALTRKVFAIAGGVPVYDTQTGLRAFSSDKFADYIKIKGDRYEYEMNMLLFAAQSGTKIYEFAIETIYLNDNESSHFNPFWDSIKIYACILKYCISSVLSFLIDYALFLLIAAFTDDFFKAAVSIFIAEVGARIISALFNFFFNKKIVFKGNEDTGKALGKYAVLAVFTLAVDYLFVMLMYNILHIPKSVAKIISGVILFAINMVLQGKFVFRKKQNT